MYQSKLFNPGILLIVTLLLLAGCASDNYFIKPEKQPGREDVLVREEDSCSSPAPSGEAFAASEIDEKEHLSLSSLESPTDAPSTIALEPLKKSDQEILDFALGFCQASTDFWEQGDLDNALDALDQAYSLILQVDSDQEPEILQQRDDLRFTISKRIIECYSSRFTVANGYHKAIPLVMNEHVEKALKSFKGRNRRFFLDSYRRSGKYRPAIVIALKEAGLPEELSWLPLIESGFKVRALSRARALGLWQFIASTGYKFGLKRDRWVDERMDPEKSTRAAIGYLKELHQIFGDWSTVLAAYNCGEGAVLRRIRTQRINYLDNFWDLYEKLPTETAFYVPKFLAVLHILNDPEVHGFTLPPVEEAIETDDIAINKQIHLKTIAKNIEVSFKTLEELNPELRHNFMPSKPYLLKVPKGKGSVLLSKLDELPVYHPPVPAYVIHKVRKGESLSVIAQRYRTSVRAIMKMNRLRSGRYIRVGWRLKIPMKRRHVSLEETSTPVASAASKGEKIRYVVRKGDSLWTIANRFRTTIKAVQSLNQLESTNLQIGQALRISTHSAAHKKMKSKTYTVLKGDSSYFIAQKHRMSLSQFLKLNKLTARSTIFPGQTLLVRAE